MSVWDTLFSEELRRTEARGHLRALSGASLAPHGRIRRNDREFIDFSSNDYLGLSQHPALIARASEWSVRMGTGAGASRLVTGTSDAHLALEKKIAAFKQTESALLFATGWQANAAVLPALLKALPEAAVFTDKLIHNSLHHGCAAAGVRQIRFRHNDYDHLEKLLEERGANTSARMIITESVFSMDGDVADLERLSAIAKAHDAFLLVDEAHATGVLGPGGAGLSAALPDGVDLVMGTFSKAMGSFGAYVAGSERLCAYLINTCGGFIYSTAPPPAVLGAIDAALDIVPGMESERTKLASLGTRLRDGLAGLGIHTGTSSTQIVPAIIGDPRDALRVSESLAQRGLLATAIRPPTVPANTSRLRLALRATHEPADIDQLVAAIAECL